MRLDTSWHVLTRLDTPWHVLTLLDTSWHLLICHDMSCQQKILSCLINSSAIENSILFLMCNFCSHWYIVLDLITCTFIEEAQNFQRKLVYFFNRSTLKIFREYTVSQFYITEHIFSKSFIRSQMTWAQLFGGGPLNQCLHHIQSTTTGSLERARARARAHPIAHAHFLYTPANSHGAPYWATLIMRGWT